MSDCRRWATGRLLVERKTDFENNRTPAEANRATPNLKFLASGLLL